jgi:hypothetical protein
MVLLGVVTLTFAELYELGGLNTTLWARPLPASCSTTLTEHNTHGETAGQAKIRFTSQPSLITAQYK